MVVTTIPQVELKNIQLNGGKHNIIPVDCPQGYIHLYYSFQKNQMLKYNDRLGIIVRKKGQGQTLHLQNINTKEKFLTGYYDLEVLTLPRIQLNQVKVNQSLETKLEIPLPGKVKITLKEAGEGSILVLENGKLNHVIHLEKNKLEQFFMLQPGVYKVIWRANKVKSTMFTIEKGFKVESEKEYSIDLITK